jgi:DNA-binding response OmpR family regulator
MTWHVLVVEDDPNIHHLLTEKLRLEGFEVTGAYNGQSAIDLVEVVGLPHLAVVNLTLPDMDGLQLVRHFSQRGVPVIATADDARAAALESLQWGDDFMRKPVDPEELAARIRRVLSRIVDYSYAGRRIIDVDERVQLDYVNNCLIVEGEKMHLTPIEGQLLHTLMLYKGQVVDSRTLIARVWGAGAVYDDTLRVHIHRLRHKLEADPRNPKHIVTERGVGYSFRA